MSKEDIDPDKLDEEAYKDEETLRWLYYDEELSQTEIGEMFDVTPSSIGYWMGKFDIRPQTDSAPYRDEEKLKRLYYDEGMSQEEIAQELGCSKASILEWMDRFDIKTRDAGEHRASGDTSYRDKDVLEELYHEEGLTIVEIAERLDCGKWAVKNWMDKHDIERRSRSERNRLQWEKERDGPQITEDFIQEQYVERNRTMTAVARIANCDVGTIKNRLEYYGIEQRPLSESNSIKDLRKPVPLKTSRGYRKWRDTFRGEQSNISVHRLAAVAWFGFDAVCGNVVHHKNGHKWDNREENLEPLSNAEHTKHHIAEGDLIQSENGQFRRG